MSDAGASAGARLRAERERQGMSLPKAAQSLRLDPETIAALEANRFAPVGPPVFVRGHLKRYAKLLALPEEEILSAYEVRDDAPVPQAPVPEIARSAVPPVATLRWPPLAVGAVVVLAIGVVWLKPWRARHAPSPVERHAESVADTAPASAAAPVAGVAPTVPQSSSVQSAPPRRAAVATPPIAAPPGAAAGAAPGSGRARLRLSFSADSWVDVHDAAGHRVYAGNGRANSVKTLSGDAPMHVYLRYASGVQLEINNRAVAIGRQFMAGDMARFEAGADGVLRREPADPAPIAQTNSRPNG